MTNTQLKAVAGFGLLVLATVAIQQVAVGQGAALGLSAAASILMLGTAAYAVRTAL